MMGVSEIQDHDQTQQGYKRMILNLGFFCQSNTLRENSKRSNTHHKKAMHAFAAQKRRRCNISFVVSKAS